MLTSASAPGVPVPAQPTPTSEPTAIADPTFGGLGGAWILTGWGDVNAPTAPLEGSAVNVNFGAEGISGSSGCNSYSGGFQYNNGVLVVQPLATTLMACEQPVMDQEGAFLNALQGATGYQINGDMLTLFYDGGVLTFSRAAEG
ncbi:MAG: META domain-containing protein [Anaerolineae bacterium]|nr:META domain-containing protein [Anaerolineae bacterium]